MPTASLPSQGCVVPWNPGRVEQRNGRIDRTLQSASRRCSAPTSGCPSARKTRCSLRLERKSDQIRQELGCLPPVVIPNPRVRNDNPFSELLFRSVKYRPD
jgi:hypothetical protein